MRKNIFYLLAGVFILTSCTLEEDFNMQTDNFIHVKAFNEKASEYTRSITAQKIDHRWNNGDVLGVYAKGVLSTEEVSTVNLGNQKMTASVSGNNVNFGKLPFQWNSQLQDFYIYYPYSIDSQTDYEDSKVEVKGSLPSVQTQAGAYEKLENNGHNFLYRIYKGIGKPGDGILYLRDFSSFFPTYQFTVLCADQFYANMNVESLEITTDVPFNTGDYTIDLMKISTGINSLKWKDPKVTVQAYKVDLGSDVKLKYNMSVNIFTTLPPVGKANLICRLILKDGSGHTHVFAKTMNNQDLTVGKSAYTYILMGDEEPPSTTEEPANCYVLKPGGQVYIPVSQVNAATSIDPTVPPINSGEILTPELIWTDVKGSVSGKGLASDASIAAFRVIGKGPQAVLEVKAGEQFGNSVVAIKNINGNIKWSWHIWVTDYDPKIETGQNTIGGYVFMDRNLGATSITPRADGAYISGTYYQWGRKEPFPGNAEGYSTLSSVPVYDMMGNILTAQDANFSTSLALIQYPYTWITHNTGFTSDLELWGNSGVKTALDPCPVGWRVPKQDAFAGLNDVLFPMQGGVTGVTCTGRIGKHTGFFPINGDKRGNATLRNKDFIHNWSCLSLSNKNGVYLRCPRYEAGVIQPSFSDQRASGYGVRCVRDWTKGKLEREVRVMTSGRDAFSTSHQVGANVGSTGYQTTILPLLVQNFGDGEHVNTIFKFYNNTNGTAAGNFSVVDKLVKNDIDVLWLTYPSPASSTSGGAMTAEQAIKIKSWLEADNHRIIGLNMDNKGESECFKALLTLFGISPSLGSVNGTLTVIDNNNSFGSEILRGVYGNVSSSNFTVPENSGYWNRAELEANGFVPFLTSSVDPANKVVLAINPNKRIIIYGDSDMRKRALAVNGDLTFSTYGPYPKLEANIWAWIVKTVKGGYY